MYVQLPVWVVNGHIRAMHFAASETVVYGTVSTPRYDIPPSDLCCSRIGNYRTVRKGTKKKIHCRNQQTEKVPVPWANAFVCVCMCVCVCVCVCVGVCLRRQLYSHRPRRGRHVIQSILMNGGKSSSLGLMSVVQSYAFQILLTWAN